MLGKKIRNMNCHKKKADIIMNLNFSITHKQTPSLRNNVRSFLCLKIFFFCEIYFCSTPLNAFQKC